MKCPKCSILVKKLPCDFCGFSVPAELGSTVKKNKTELRQLVEKLDKVFADYVKEKNKVAGVYKCFTCDKIFPLNRIQLGHFHSRKYYAIRWDEFNAECQCVSCNCLNHGMQYEFGKRLEKKHGVEIVNQLAIKKNNRFKLEKFTLEIMIKEYSSKLSKLRDKPNKK